jgi:hypothetical protein
VPVAASPTGPMPYSAQGIPRSFADADLPGSDTMVWRGGGPSSTDAKCRFLLNLSLIV